MSGEEGGDELEEEEEVWELGELPGKSWAASSGSLLMMALNAISQMAPVKEESRGSGSGERKKQDD